MLLSRFCLCNATCLSCLIHELFGLSAQCWTVFLSCNRSAAGITTSQARGILYWHYYRLISYYFIPAYTIPFDARNALNPDQMAGPMICPSKSVADLTPPIAAWSLSTNPRAIFWPSRVFCRHTTISNRDWVTILTVIPMLGASKITCHGRIHSSLSLIAYWHLKLWNSAASSPYPQLSILCLLFSYDTSHILCAIWRCPLASFKSCLSSGLGSAQLRLRARNRSQYG